MSPTDVQQKEKPDSGVSDEDYARRWKTLAVILVGSFMALLDTTVVNVALPSAQESLEASSSTLEWVISAYALSFGLVLVLTGRLGDTRGRKKFFILGLFIFTLASAACGLAQSPNQLVGARIIQGVGAGCFLPQISATIQALFKGRERARALGMLGAVVGLSTALGPIVGGVLLHIFGDETGWRTVFLVNLPIGVIGIAVAMKLMPETRNPSESGRSLDPIGLTLLTLTLLLLLFPLTEGQSKDWPVWTFVMFVLVIPFGTAFYLWERRLERQDKVPVLPISLLRNPSFAAGSALGLVYFAGFASFFFLMSIFWQNGLGHSALHSGLTVLPFALGSMISAPLSARITDRIGARTMTVGSSMLLVGLAAVGVIVHVMGADVTTAALILPLAVAGIGNGMVIAPNQRYVLAKVPVVMAGVGGAVIQTTQRIGTAIGVSALGTVFYGSLNLGVGVDKGQAFVHAFQLALLVNLVAVVLALVCSLRVPELDEGS